MRRSQRQAELGLFRNRLYFCCAHRTILSILEC